MPSLIDIRRRIRSVKNTQQITKAMKMVSAAKLQRILANVAEAAAQGGGADHPLLAVRPENRILAVVITADRGLAGGFNSNLLRLAQRFADEHRAAELTFEVIGKKARDYFRKRGARIRGEHLDIFRKLRFENAEAIAGRVIDLFAKSEIDAVYLFVNEFKSVLASKLTSTRLLPIEVPRSGQPADYIYEQRPEELLGSLLPRYVKMQIYRALLESEAAEHAARMTAMESATKNASEAIDRLTLYMNRVRQASITREIIEIVSGAAALE